MFSGTIESVSAALRTASNYTSLNTNPRTVAELQHNKNLRHSMLTDVLVKLKSIDACETAAAKQFWTMQTAILIDYLSHHADRFNAEFDLQLSNDGILNKEKLIVVIDKLLLVLSGTDNNKKMVLLQPLIEESHTILPARAVDISNHNPSVVFQCSDSIAFVRKLTADNKVVVIMDAANAQRPGAGAYEKGTFQEALTRNTDLYWKILADFCDVFQRAIKENRTSLTYTLSDSKPDIISFQASYLEMILFFIKKTLLQSNYFDQPESRDAFLKYSNQIYTRIQNTVLEIPAYQAFLKNCRLLDLTDLKKTSDLFNKEGNLKIDVKDRAVGNVYVVEVAAPDLRSTEGKVDRSCTVDDARRGNQKPKRIIRAAIENTICIAMQVNADALVLNAFGCKAFENDPETVAVIFAQALLKYRNALQGKSIYFIDLDPRMCAIFSKIFNDALGRLFDFNCLHINGVKLQVRHGNLQGVFNKDLVYAPTQIAAASYGTDNGAPINPQQVLFPIEKNSKTMMSLKNELVVLLQQTLQKTTSDVIHLPLLGAGKRGFHPCDCMQALLEAIEQVSKQRPELKDKHFMLHIPEDAKYQTIIDWLTKDRLKERSNEIKKYYQLIHPDPKRRKDFGVGLFTTHLRIATNESWKPWSPIIKGKLYLGIIPSISDAALLYQTIPNLKQVISCVEDFELAGIGIGFITPNIQTASAWARYGIEQQQIFVKDGHADDFPIIEVAKTVGKILRRIANNEAVYVHCKAGRSRSATVVGLALYFLIKKEGDCSSIQEIYDYLKTVRPEISLTSVEIATMKAVIALLEKRPELLQADPLYHQTLTAPIIGSEIKQHIDTYLRSDKGKADIAQLPAFKDLKYQALQNTAEAKGTQNLLDDIFNLNSSAWLLHTCQFDNPFYTSLRSEVLELLTQQLNIAKQNIMQVLGIPSAELDLRTKILCK